MLGALPLVQGLCSIPAHPLHPPHDRQIREEEPTHAIGTRTKYVGIDTTRENREKRSALAPGADRARDGTPPSSGGRRPWPERRHRRPSSGAVPAAGPATGARAAPPGSPSPTAVPRPWAADPSRTSRRGAGGSRTAGTAPGPRRARPSPLRRQVGPPPGRRRHRGPGTRADHNRFDDPVHAPSGWTGTMPNDETGDGKSTFLSLHSFSKNYPKRPEVQAHPDGGAAPVLVHRAGPGSALAPGAYFDLLE
ncbi:glycoside hydrolase family 48 protein [Streptomyces sp. NPDC060198]|uniref:glycoside hydrolase family 48 protein n=1 Tax=Streptomyces sp. NPDC060198 TaxID=3347070 RepID=UPI00364EA6D8